MPKWCARICYRGLIEEYGDTEEEALSAAEMELPMDVDEWTTETFECDDDGQEE